MSLITRLDNGGPLTIEQMDNNLLYLQEIALGGGGTGSGGFGATGATGATGAAGPQGPTGSLSIIDGTFGAIPMLNETLDGYTASVITDTLNNVIINKPLIVDSLVDGKSGLFVNRLKPIDFIIASASFYISEDMDGSSMSSMTVTNNGIIYGVNSYYELVRIENIVGGGLNQPGTFSFSKFEPNYTSGPLGTIYADDYSQVIWFLQDDGQFINLVKMSMSDNSVQDIITFNAEVTADFRMNQLTASVDFIATQNELFICSRYDGNSSTTDYTYNSNNTKIWKLNKNTNAITFLAVAEMVYKNPCTSAVLSNGFIYVPCFMGSGSDMVKINATTGTSTRFNINRTGYNSPLNTITADDNGNIYIASLQYNSEVIKFDPLTEQFTLYFKNYIDNQGTANNLLSSGAYSMVYNTDSNLLMLTDRNYTGVYYIKETTDNNVPALNNFYYYMQVSGNYNSVYTISNEFVAYGADSNTLYRVTADILSIGIGVDKNGEIVAYTAPDPVIPPSDWDSESGSTQILNKPTKLSEFTNDLIINWDNLHGNQRNIGLIDFNTDNMGVFLNVLTVTSSVINNVGSYGFKCVEYCGDRFIALYVDDDVNGNAGIDVYMSYTGDTWSKIGDRLELFPTYTATNIIGCGYVNGKLVLSTNYYSGFGNNTYTIIYYSNDKGETWASQNIVYGTLPLQGGFNNILYVNGHYLLIGYSDTYFFASTDFINWSYYSTAITGSPFASGTGTNGIIYFNGKYYMQSNSSGNNTGIASFAYSNDLNSWDPVVLGLSPSISNLVGTGWFVVEDTLYNFCYQRPGDLGYDAMYVLKTTDGITFTLDVPYDIDNPSVIDNNFFYGQIKPTGYVNGYFVQVIGPKVVTGYSNVGYIYSKDGIAWKFKKTTPGTSVRYDIGVTTVGNNRLFSIGMVYTDIYSYNQPNQVTTEVYSLFLDDGIVFINNVNDFQINGLSILPEEKILDIKLQGYYVQGTDVYRMDKYVGATVSATYSVDWLIDKHHIVMTGNTTLSQVNTIPDGYSKTINLFVSGNFTLTLPSAWTTNLSGTYSTTKLNKITVDYIRPNLYWAKIEN